MIQCNYREGEKMKMKKGQFACLIAVIVLGLGGIFGYVKYRLDKQEVDTNKTTQNQNTNVNQEKTEKGLLTDAKVKEYLDMVPFRLASYNIKDAYYGTTTYKADVKELLLYNALKNGISDDEICGNGVDSYTTSYKVSDINKILVKYNTSVEELNVTEFYPEEDIKVLKVNADTYCTYIPGRGGTFLEKNTISFAFEEKNDDLIINEKALFTLINEVPDKVYQTTNRNASSIYTFTQDFDVMESYNAELNKKINELSDKAYTFKHTFKKMNNGEYYWYSTEVMK